MDAFTGEIRLFAGPFAPLDWLFCDGQLLPVNQYTALYSLIGNTYGGTANVNFNLPDLRGRVPMGTGNGQNLTPRYLGSVAGTNSVTLTSGQMAVHTHTVQGKATGGVATNDPASNTWANVPPTVKIYAADPNINMSPQAVEPAVSGGLPHTNIQPSVGINYIICVNGYYPAFP
ncbi:hypothetical protein SRRS_41680 [Sporomusa rhizae]|uniref:phage tail protein n=1 Tax=Sporomusa rhizae TaxID=357999 RepID=UPI00352A0C6E